MKEVSKLKKNTFKNDIKNPECEMMWRVKLRGHQKKEGK